jgi:glycosyltransferase involved in cell wall biosynthesis
VNSAERPVMSSIWSDAPRWNELVDYSDESRVRGTLADHIFLWRLSRGKEAVILLGSVSLRHRYKDLIFALLLKFRKPRPRIVISDATWEPKSRVLSRYAPWAKPLLPAAIRLIVRLIDGSNVRFCVLSTAELDSFPVTWGVDPSRVIFTPFPATIPKETPYSTGDYFFSGGNSLRDYSLLLDAVSGTGLRGIIRTDWRRDTPLPKEIVSGQVPHAQFLRELADCRVALFPLEVSRRSAGQQSYLNAMLLEKVVIVTEAPGVRDYITHGVTGIIVPPDRDALRRAVLHAMDPANDDYYLPIRRAARAAVLQDFTIEIYQDCYLLGAAGYPCPERE